MNQTPQKEWEIYEKLNVPQGADIIQRAETRKAFISGMYRLLLLFTIESDTDEQIANLVKAIEKEADDYAHFRAKRVYREREAQANKNEL